MNTLIEAVLFLCQETFRENAVQVTTLQSNRLQAQDICQLITYWHLLINIILRLLSFLYYMHPNYKIYIFTVCYESGEPDLGWCNSSQVFRLVSQLPALPDDPTTPKKGKPKVIPTS